LVVLLQKNRRLVIKADRLPHSSHTVSLLWLNPIHSNGVIIKISRDR